VGLAREDALQRIPQLLEVVVDRGDDDRHILTCIVGLGRNWNGFVDPMAPKVDDCTSVSVEPAGPVSVVF